MKIKRFFAPDMREALRLVKEELGVDAVILSNTTVDNGVEVTTNERFATLQINKKTYLTNGLNNN